ncbi:MAG TPA: hemolysin family protein, partial [Anaerolineae bacterium]|nr:hemolysin family protein [Anaerolineae bacterium]
ERIATRVAQPMRLLSQVARPVVALLNISSTFVIRLLGVKPSAEPQVTEEEIRVLIEQGTELGVFEESEQDMIESILRLGDRRVEAFMTPRTKIVALELEDAPEESKQKIINGHHSHYPVVQDSLDNVIGMVRTKDLVVQALQQQPLEVQAVMQSPLFVPESMTALEVLERFKVEGMHVALITDEYGGIQGMVTQNDILEAIVDDLPGSDRLMQPQIVQRADGSWLVDGLLHIDKLKELLDVEMLPDEEEEGFQTVGGFMVSQFNDIPRAGQVFDWDRFNFEVVDMDGRRVDKILITGHQVAPAESAEGDG